jgi:E3 ubiquitin-protein ligase DOA10
LKLEGVAAEDTDTEFEIEDIPEEREEEIRTPCRICLYETFEYDNPLVSCCYCSGTMKYIHIDCLKTWMESRRQHFETGLSHTYYWKNYNCELCKFEFPLKITHQGRKFQLFDMPTMVAPYIILETNENSKNQTKSIHFITMAND